jgi:hypothetical protein
VGKQDTPVTVIAYPVHSPILLVTYYCIATLLVDACNKPISNCGIFDRAGPVLIEEMSGTSGCTEKERDREIDR